MPPPPSPLTLQRAALHMRTCGHVLHTSCFQRHLQHQQHEAGLDPQLNSRLNSNAGAHMCLLRRVKCVFSGEFFCPCCRRLGNALVPIVPPLEGPNLSTAHVVPEDWRRSIQQRLVGSAGCRPVWSQSPTASAGEPSPVPPSSLITSPMLMSLVDFQVQVGDSMVC